MLSSKRTKDLERKIEELQRDVQRLSGMVFSLSERLSKVEASNKPKYFGG